MQVLSLGFLFALAFAVNARAAAHCEDLFADELMVTAANDDYFGNRDAKEKNYVDVSAGYYKTFIPNLAKENLTIPPFHYDGEHYFNNRVFRARVGTKGDIIKAIQLEIRYSPEGRRGPIQNMYGMSRPSNFHILLTSSGFGRAKNKSDAEIRLDFDRRYNTEFYNVKTIRFVAHVMTDAGPGQLVALVHQRPHRNRPVHRINKEIVLKFIPDRR